MAAPIQSPAKCEVRSAIRNETDGFRAEVSHALRTGRKWVSGLHFDWRWNIGFSPHSWKFGDDGEVQDEVMTWFKGLGEDFYDSGYRSWFQDLINVWTMPATLLKNKVMYRQFIHSVAFVNKKYCTCLRHLYLYFPDTPRICNVNGTVACKQSKKTYHLACDSVVLSVRYCMQGN
jgi:hypothetical protein